MSKQKPSIPIDMDGNIFVIVGAARRALKRDGQNAACEEMSAKVTASGSYDEALQVVMSYVEFA